METVNPRSTAAIAGHPVHPMLVMFPVVLFILVWVCDLLLLSSGELFWATVGLIALAAGLLTAAAAAVVGLIDYLGEPRIRALRAANRHIAANVLLVAVQLGNIGWRMSGGPDWVLPTGLLLSSVAMILLGYSAWQGATMVYQHRVGVDSGVAERQGG